MVLSSVLCTELSTIFDLLGYYAASVGSLTFRDKLSSSIFKGQSVQALCLKMGLICFTPKRRLKTTNLRSVSSVVQYSSCKSR